MLGSEAEEPTRSHVHEAQLPILIDVEVLYLTDEAAPGIQDPLLAQFVVRRLGVLVVRKVIQLHGYLLSPRR